MANIAENTDFAQSSTKTSKRKKSKLYSDKNASGHVEKECFDQADQHVIKPKRSLWKNLQHVFRIRGKRSEVPELNPESHVLAPPIHRLNAIFEEPRTPDEAEITDEIEEMKKTLQELPSPPSHPPTPPSESAAADKDDALIDFLSEASSTSSGEEVAAMAAQQQAADEEEETPVGRRQATPAPDSHDGFSFEYSTASEQSADEAKVTFHEHVETKDADSIIAVRALRPHVLDVDGGSVERKSSFFDLKHPATEAPREELDAAPEEVVAVVKSLGPAAAAAELEELEVWSERLDGLAAPAVATPCVPGLRLGRWFTVVAEPGAPLRCVVAYDAAALPEHWGAAAVGAPSEERNKVVRKRKWMSLLHDKRVYETYLREFEEQQQQEAATTAEAHTNSPSLACTGSPSSAGSGADTLQVLQDARRRLLFPHTYRDIYALTEDAHHSTGSVSSTAACNERLDAYQAVDSDVQTLISELLVQSAELRDECIAHSGGRDTSEDEPPVECKEHAVFARQLLDVVLEGVWAAVDVQDRPASICLRTGSAAVAGVKVPGGGGGLRQGLRRTVGLLTELCAELGDYQPAAFLPTAAPPDPDLDSPPRWAAATACVATLGGGAGHSKHRVERQAAEDVVRRIERAVLPHLDAAAFLPLPADDELEPPPPPPNVDTLKNNFRNSHRLGLPRIDEVDDDNEQPSSSSTASPEVHTLLARNMSELTDPSQHTVPGRWGGAPSPAHSLPDQLQLQRKPPELDLQEASGGALLDRHMEANLQAFRHHSVHSTHSTPQGSLSILSTISANLPEGARPGHSAASLAGEFYSADDLLLSSEATLPGSSEHEVVLRRWDNSANSLLDAYYSCVEVAAAAAVPQAPSTTEPRILPLQKHFNFGVSASKVFSTELERRAKVNFGQSQHED